MVDRVTARDGSCRRDIKISPLISLALLCTDCTLLS